MIRKKWKYFLISAALLTIIFVSIERYNNYIGQKVYQESTQGLFATYEQLDKTFLMFAQRNWNGPSKEQNEEICRGSVIPGGDGACRSVRDKPDSKGRRTYWRGIGRSCDDRVQ